MGCRARVPVKTLPPGEGKQVWLEVEEAHKGFASLKGLRSAMDAMRLSHATGQQGARVSQAFHCTLPLALQYSLQEAKQPGAVLPGALTRGYQFIRDTSFIASVS